MHDIRGSIIRYNKTDIAMEYLNLALLEYIKGENMFSVLHLSGASEEIFGKIVRFNNQKNAQDNSVNWIKKWYQLIKKDTPSDQKLKRHIIKFKNAVKHVNSNTDLELEVDIQREAEETIRRALTNFNHIPELVQSKEMLEYFQHIKR